MGRYVSAGILTEMIISKKEKNWYTDSNFDLKVEINKVLEDISSIIDINKYDMVETDNSFYFKLKLDFINEGIYDLLTEMKGINNRINFINCITSSKDEDLKNQHIICEIKNNRYVIKSDENGSYSNAPFYPFYWIFSDKHLFDNIKITGELLPIWMDQNKIDGEDETFMLMAMNKMKTKYFESELSKCLIFEIMG